MSSGGGLLQLVAYGSQDLYLTASPQITFFSVLYKRHTQFAIESLEQSWSGGTLDFGRKATVIVSRSGDLIHKAYLQIELPAMVAACGQTVRWTRDIGVAMIDEISYEVGGSTIDRHYGIWLHIWSELTQRAEKRDAWNLMIGNTPSLIEDDPNKITTPQATLYVPLAFPWNRNAGLALPIIALAYHEVRIVVSFRPANECYITSDGRPPQSGTPSLRNVALYIDFVYLDTAERKLFSSNTHEFLIEQLQYQWESSCSNNLRTKLSFSHPTKYLVWVVQPEQNISNGNNRWTDFTDSGPNTILAYQGSSPLLEAKIQFNSQDRISTRPAAYFNILQPYYYFTRVPATGIYVFSLALSPEAQQPSGSANLSRLEGVTLVQTLATGNLPVRVHCFAVNYNILRVVSGMAGVAYA